MGEILLLLPLIVIGIVIYFVAMPLINMFKNTFGDSPSAQGHHRQDARYTRTASSIHKTKTAEEERLHYLDQLKSLYEAGMMERDEYNERVAAVEADYRGR